MKNWQLKSLQPLYTTKSNLQTIWHKISLYLSACNYKLWTGQEIPVKNKKSGLLFLSVNILINS